MTFVQLIVTIIGLMGAMIAMVLLGSRLGHRRLAKYAEAKPRGNTVETAVFSLLGLLISFSFYGAINRYDQHRTLIADEVNAISTAHMRVDLVPLRAQEEMHARIRAYVETRIAVYRARVQPGSPAAIASRVALDRVWQQAVDACRTECSPATSALVFGALDQMFRFPIDQGRMRRMHPPIVVFALLFGLALLAAFLIGYDMNEMKRRNWFYVVVFPVVISITVGVTLDVEYPRGGGLTGLHSLDEMLVGLRVEMK